MKVSADDAQSIFKKWEEEKSPVRLIFKAMSAGGIFTGRIFRSSRSEVTMVLSGESVDPTSGFITVSLLLADSFSFIDPRDGGEDRELLSGEMEFGIFVPFTSGERCTWVALPVTES